MSVMLPSLNILNLLTDLFDLGFEVNDRVFNIGILALRAGSVSLAVKLLKQKVDLSAYRRACFKHLTELRWHRPRMLTVTEMAAAPMMQMTVVYFFL